MAIVAAGLAAIAAVEAAEVLRAGGEAYLGGGAQYIRDGQPVGAVAQLGQGLARLACRRYGSNPASYPSDTALNYERACRPYLEDIGEGAGPGLELPFRGGQCAASYIMTWASDNDNGTTSGATVLVRGPVGGVRRLVTGTQFQNQVFCHALNAGTSSCGTLADGGAAWRTLSGGNSPTPGGSIRITNLAPCGANDCGNPPPDVTQPQPPTIVLPPIVPIIIAPDINVDAEVEVNLDGTLNINIGTGDININPFADPDGGGDDGGGGSPPSPPSPEPGPELPGGNGGFGGDDGFGAPPAGRRWVGCCIRITQKPDNAGIITGSQPEDVYPSVIGNIRLVFNAGGTRATDTPVRIAAKHVCVWEPVSKLNPVGVNVDLLPGFGYVYTPYSVPLED